MIFIGVSVKFGLSCLRQCALSVHIPYRRRSLIRRWFGGDHHCSGVVVAAVDVVAAAAAAAASAVRCDVDGLGLFLLEARRAEPAGGSRAALLATGVDARHLAGAGVGHVDAAAAATETDGVELCGSLLHLLVVLPP